MQSNDQWFTSEEGQRAREELHKSIWMECGGMVEHEPWEDEVGMSADVRMIADELSKILKDEWGRQRDEWHIESVRACVIH